MTRRLLIWTSISVGCALLLYVAAIAYPRVSLFWGYAELKKLIFEELGVQSDAWASFFALIGSFISAVAWGPMVWWTARVVYGGFKFWKTTIALALWLLVYGHKPFLRAVLGSEVCYNQRTGQPLKWYVVQPGGQITLYDSPGYDASGTAKRPVTQQLCRGIEAQKRGVKPKLITEDARLVKFFDEVSGLPRVWYYKPTSGEFELFDAEGIHPNVGEALLASHQRDCGALYAWR
jgi:hypothetical protein